ncbi:MAG: hypothetical protein F6K19_38565 [Cyanothece sp. SIO1E1]|nr:hypothetical protein [Cyanothece sp. SIO1E1]
MSDFCLLVAGILAQDSTLGWQLATKLPIPKDPVAATTEHSYRSRICQSATSTVAPITPGHRPEFSHTDNHEKSVRPELAPPPSRVRPAAAAKALNPTVRPTVRISPKVLLNPIYNRPLRQVIPPKRPASGSQLYQQRWAALRAGKLHTRLPVDSFHSVWAQATQQPTYQQWKHLLAQEARAIAKGQGKNRLTVLLGDSISLWFPQERLSADRFWLNQGISGDTTAGVLQRLPALAPTRPDTIHVMVGINDLRRGVTSTEVLHNLQQIMRRLRNQHPQADVIVHSILPTRLVTLSNPQIRQINQQLAILAQQEQVSYLDLQSEFTDAWGDLKANLTTDGLHLNPQGYNVWDLAMR